MNEGYDPSVVIENSDSGVRMAVILVLMAIAGLGGYMQYYGAIKTGRRDKMYCIPLATNLWNFAHDTTFVASYSSWFDNENELWILKLFWFGLIVFSILELVVISHIVRFARKDLWGDGCTVVQAIAIYSVLQLFVFGIFWWFQAITDDPLEYYGLATTVLMASAFNISMMRARGSQRGMSEFILWGYLILSCGFWPWMMVSDPDHFTHPIYFLMAIGNIGVDIVSIKVFRSLPAYTPEPAPAPTPTPQRAWPSR
ncbi:MAG: hypothetical protein ACT4QG_11450 [Sporichthyaceae bacterium]